MLSNCATVAPINYEKITEGRWSAKALVKDKEQSRTYIVNLDLNAVREKQLRMDVSAALGTTVAALVVNGKEVKYLLVEPKKYYFGKSRADVMRPILSVPFDPRWLHNILFEIPFAEKNWSCSRDPKGLLLECKDANTGVKITWSARNGQKKTVFLEHARANVQMNFSSFKPKVEERADLFELKAPQGFDRFNVR